MEAIIVKQNVLRPQSPPSKAALTLDGQRSDLLLPFVSKLANDNSHHHGEPLDERFVIFEKNEGEHFSKSVANSGRGFDENTIPQVPNYPASEQVKIQRDQKCVKCHYFAKNDYSDESKSTGSTEQKYSSDKERGTILNQQVFQYGVLCVIIVLIVMLVHLHTKIVALESSGVSSTSTGCQCEKAIVTQIGRFNDQRPKVNNEIVDSNKKDAHEQIMAYFDSEKQEPSPGDDTAKLVIDSKSNKNIPSNKKHPIFKAVQGENKSIDRMQTWNNIVEGNFKSKSKITNLIAEILNKTSNDSAYLSSTTDGNRPREVKSVHNVLDNNFKTVDTFPQINKIQRVDLTDFTTDIAGQELFRIKRSLKKVIDTRFNKDLQAQRRQHQKEEQEKRNADPQVETFEVPFYTLHFNLLEHFLPQDPLSIHKDCTTRHPWGHDIEACKDTRVIFPEKYSVLPFYLPTTTTVMKDSKNRMAHVDSRGKFVVNIPGSYVFQLNITIWSESENQFLALYLNDQAMLTCQGGGFLCPHINWENSSYKVCTIIGVLDLMKDDILDIRTMEHNMTVLAEANNLRKSQIKFILLSKIK